MTTMTTTGTASLRRLLLRVAVAALASTALLGVLALMPGSTFGETEGRILLTTLVVGCASVCLLCYLATAGTPYAVVGAVGGMLLLLPVVTALRLVWAEWDAFPGEGWLKALLVGIVLAVSLAQASLLLGLAGSRRNLRALLWSTTALVAVLASLLTMMILEEAEVGSLWRTIGIIAILDVLGTLVTIAVARFGGSSTAAEPRASVAVPAELEAVLTARAEADGRGVEDLLTEALERYLRSR